MSTIAERIEAAEKSLTNAKDLLVERTTELEDTPDDDALIESVDALSGQVEHETKKLESLRRAEKALADRAEQASVAPAMIQRRTPSIDGMDLIGKEAHIAARSFAEARNPLDVVKEFYPEDHAIETLVKAAQNPAMTSVAGWAQELVAIRNDAFMSALEAESAVAQLPLERFTFGRNGSVKIPVETDTGSTLDGAWISEGDPIPVGKMSFSSITLREYKLARITHFTREMMEQSNPDIENVLRRALVRRAAVKLDKEFFGAGVAKATGTNQRPAGLQGDANTVDTAAGGATLADIISDLKGVLSRISTAMLGQRLRLVMNPTTAASIALQQSALGTFIFRSEVGSASLLGVPIVTSHNIPATEYWVLDCAHVALASRGPIIEASDVATLHEESTAPLPIVDGTPTTASPVRSLWQTNSRALKLYHPLSWGVLRAGAAQRINTVAY